MKPGENGSYTVSEFIVVCGIGLGALVGTLVASPVYGVERLVCWCNKKGAKKTK